jgi:hypothetical protein
VLRLPARRSLGHPMVGSEQAFARFPGRQWPASWASPPVYLKWQDLISDLAAGQKPG